LHRKIIGKPLGKIVNTALHIGFVCFADRQQGNLHALMMKAQGKMIDRYAERTTAEMRMCRYANAGKPHYVNNRNGI
jgi:hypothetical protein